MSASTTIAFYGIRLELADDEIESLEDRTHPAIVRARKAGLRHYWGNFGGLSELHLLFIGELLGKLGVEEANEICVSAEQFAQIAADVSSRLSVAGFSELPALLLQFHLDL